MSDAGKVRFYFQSVNHVNLAKNCVRFTIYKGFTFVSWFIILTHYENILKREPGNFK